MPVGQRHARLTGTPRTPIQIGGAWCRHGIACSNCRERAKISASAKALPTNCRPIGSPCRVNPIGMLAAGRPTRFIKTVKAASLAAPANASAAGRLRNAPIRGAGRATVGITQMSAVENAGSNLALSVSKSVATSCDRSTRPAVPSQHVTGCVRPQRKSGNCATWCCQSGRNSSSDPSGRHPSSTSCPSPESVDSERTNPFRMSGWVGPRAVRVTN